MGTHDHQIPEELLKALDTANERSSAAKRHLEEAIEATEYEHQGHIDKRTEELRAAEREVEEVTRKIDGVMKRGIDKDAGKEHEGLGEEKKE